MVVFVGLMVFYARDIPDHSTLNVFLAGAGLMGSVMVSYASARAESLIPKCDVGFLRRPERVVLFIIGALSTHPGSNNFFANRMPAVLWVLAVGSYWTFAHRMYHTWRELAKVEAVKTENAEPLPIADLQLPIDRVKHASPSAKMTT
jgi:CDP-diacylglycerol--glycerol-3-phosphate 3-phosphatidyltransferase